MKTLEEIQQEFALLKFEEHKLEAELTKLKRNVKSKGLTLADAMIDAGIQKTRVNTPAGAMTLFTRTKRYLRAKEGHHKGTIGAALSKCGEGWVDLLKWDYNTNSLNARVREACGEEGGEEFLPELLLQVADLVEEPDLGTRR